MGRLLHDPEVKAPPPLRAAARPGHVLPVCVDAAGVARLDARPWAQAAAVVLDHRTGEVVALVGGYEDGLEGFVRATQARRQPGSAFKPFVYAAALAAGRSQLDTIQDAPLSLPAGGGKMWSPRNYSGGYSGPVTLRSALARSLNTPAVRLAMEVGPEEVVRTARAMGVATPLRRDLTVSLGTSEVTPMDLALGYATIARGGVSAEPVVLAELRDVDGRVLPGPGGSVRLADGSEARLPGPGSRVLSAGVAYSLADMLGEVVRGGTGRRAWVLAQERAGKTGTTSGYVDAWFVGFTPTHVVAVWVGTDGVASLGEGETGSRAALPAWIRIVEALPPTDGMRLPVPPETILVPHGGAWVALERGRVPPAALATPRPAPWPLPPYGGWPGR